MAEFVEDVTIPDETVLEPGQAFTKTWRVRNNGVMEWGEGVVLVFQDGAQMGANNSVPVSNTQPGDTIDISVDMVAPAEHGNYTSEWRLETADGAWLTTLWAVMVVASPEPVPAGQEGVEIQSIDPTTGQTRTFTLPCGSPIPAGAVCICNCVAGAPVCTCDGVCACVGHCTCDRVSAGHYWHPC